MLDMSILSTYGKRFSFFLNQKAEFGKHHDYKIPTISLYMLHATGLGSLHLSVADILLIEVLTGQLEMSPIRTA